MVSSIHPSSRVCLTWQQLPPRMSDGIVPANAQEHNDRAVSNRAGSLIRRATRQHKNHSRGRFGSLGMTTSIDRPRATRARFTSCAGLHRAFHPRAAKLASRWTRDQAQSIHEPKWINCKLPILKNVSGCHGRPLRGPSVRPKGPPLLCLTGQKQGACEPNKPRGSSAQQRELKALLICYLSDTDPATWGGPMDEKPYLRRQALLCLKLSQSCSDAETAQHLDLMAAEFHAQALRQEFHASTDSGLSADTFNKKDIEHLLLLLGSTDIVDFDERARQRIGEFISRAVSSGKLGITT